MDSASASAPSGGQPKRSDGEILTCSKTRSRLPAFSAPRPSARAASTRVHALHDVEDARDRIGLVRLDVAESARRRPGDQPVPAPRTWPAPLERNSRRDRRGRPRGRDHRFDRLLLGHAHDRDGGPAPGAGPQLGLEILAKPGEPFCDVRLHARAGSGTPGATSVCALWRLHQTIIGCRSRSWERVELTPVIPCQ